MSKALTLEGVGHHFGGFRVLNSVDLTIPQGGRTALIGPNGAGKTTLFNVMDGSIRPASGRVLLGTEDVTRVKTHKRARLGLARTYQVTNLLTRLTVEENIGLAIAGLNERQRTNFFTPLLSAAGVKAQVFELLDNWGLVRVAQEPVSSLAYGQQRILEIVLGLARGPRVLLLDEPTAGLSSKDAELVANVVAGLPRDITVVMIEHVMGVAFQIADQICVLHHGQVLAEGSPEEVRNDPRVIDAYFGETLNAQD